MKRLAYVLLPTAAVAAAVALALPGAAPDERDPVAGRPPITQTVPMLDSYAFDVTDLNVVMAHTSDVFVAKVLGIASTDLQLGTTTYDVEIVTAIRGSQVRGQITVTQLGYVDEDGVAHVPEDQELLAPGRTYLLAGNHDPSLDSVTVYAGPHAIRRAVDQAQQESLLSQYTEASR